MNQPGPFSKMWRILPSVQNFIEMLKEELANKKSILVMLPSTISADELWPLLRAYIADRDYIFDEILLSDMPPDVAVLTWFKSALKLQWRAAIDPLSIEHLYENAEGLPEVAYLEGYDDLPPERKKDVLQFFLRWADASHIRADQGGDPVALCIMTSSEDVVLSPPATDTHLSIHWWWGLPSALEMRLLCRLLGTSRDERKCQWIESIFPALVGSDIQMADHLWDEDDPTIDGLMQRLENYSAIRKWDPATLRSNWIDGLDNSFPFRGSKSSLFRSKEMKQLWAKGALYWTPEYGVQLSTAALSVLERDEEIRHRLWRGQVEYLLPMLDRIRLAICEKLTGLYGPAWPYKWEKPKYEEDYDAVRKNPMACELGYLHYLIKTCGNLKRDRNLLPLVTQARNIRNELAHYRPVEYSDYDRLLKESEQIFDQTL